MTRANMQTSSTSAKGHGHGRARAPRYDTSTDGHRHPQARAFCSLAFCTSRRARETRGSVWIPPPPRDLFLVSLLWCDRTARPWPRLRKVGCGYRFRERNVGVVYRARDEGACAVAWDGRNLAIGGPYCTNALCKNNTKRPTNLWQPPPPPRAPARVANTRHLSSRASKRITTTT